MVVTKLMTYSGLIYSEENGMGVNAASMLSWKMYCKVSTGYYIIVIKY